MVKKTLLMMLAVLMVIAGAVSLANRPAGGSCAEQLPSEDCLVSGILLKVSDDSLLLAEDSGEQIRAMLRDTTAYDADSLQPGDYVWISYSGLMSRSIPAIIEAKKVVCRSVSGTVTSLLEGELVLTEADGAEHHVTTDEIYTPGTALTVYAEDVSGDISEPLYLRGPELTGVITGVTESGFLLDTGDDEVEVLLAENTLCAVKLEAGLNVRVSVGETMTLSLPAQYTAKLVMEEE